MFTLYASIPGNALKKKYRVKLSFLRIIAKTKVKKDDLICIFFAGYCKHTIGFTATGAVFFYEGYLFISIALMNFAGWVILPFELFIS